MHRVAKHSGIAALLTIALASTWADYAHAENEAWGGAPIEVQQDDPMATLGTQLVYSPNASEVVSVPLVFSTATGLFKAQVPASKRKIIAVAKPTPFVSPDSVTVAATEEAGSTTEEETPAGAAPLAPVGDSSLLTQVEGEDTRRRDGGIQINQPGASSRLLQAVKRITR